MTDEAEFPSPCPRKQNIRFFRDVVIKSAPIELLRVEVAKTQQAHLIGEATGMFRSPRVVDFDEANSRVVLERMPEIQAVTELAAFGQDVEALGARIGRCLAIIHQRLVLPETMTIPLQPGVAGPGPHAFLHGDFSLDNVCVSRQRSLVILDWQTSKLHGGAATYGTAYFDLAWFLTNLFYLRSRGRRFLMCQPVAPMAARFAESYLEHMPDAAGGEELGKYLEQFFCAMIAIRKKYYTWRRRVHLKWFLASYKRFIRECYGLTSDVVADSRSRVDSCDALRRS